MNEENKYKESSKNKESSRSKESSKTKETADFYTSLKKVGSIIEKQLNEHIHNFLNHEDLVKFANEHSDLIARNIQTIQKYVEVLSTFLLFPTKNDVANVAKLVLQTEEKVDKLEEQIIRLTELIERMMNKDFKEKKGKDYLSNEAKHDPDEETKTSDNVFDPINPYMTLNMLLTDDIMNKIKLRKSKKTDTMENV